MMASDDITIRILQEIRDAVRGTNDRLDATNARLDATNARLDVHIDATNAGFAALRRDFKKHEFATLTEIRESEARQQAARFRDRDEQRRRIERCEQAIEALAHHPVPGGTR
ncbi:MAG: hypothetical protein SFX73_20700 [Kofleriaceae bacterium]|nr:hypothetical protein [Kofleriaceae bacterium]